jgi:predicted DCC family thiol-disulfide oxidoreductase YuxK
MSDTPPPLLIYDGDCEFCCYCVNFARAASGERIRFQPFQSVQQDFPQISVAEFKASIQLVHGDGHVSSGARAAFEVLALGGYSRFWLFCYRWLPLFALVSEWGYRLVSRHRNGSYRLSKLFFGADLQPASLTLTNGLFLRLLALVYLAAFASFAVQALGLVGEQGILPLGPFLAAVDASYGVEKYWLLPTLFWLDSSDAAIRWLCGAGCLLSLLLLVNRFPRLCLGGLYLLYLSLYGAGQVFMTFQWDILLLECGFLAIFLPRNPVLFTWLLRWLLFRFMLQSGLVKLMSGDINWSGLSALDYHFETQPLPTVLAWYAHKLPELVLQAGVVFTFVIELAVPFLILMPRRPRMLAALLIAGFQLLIILTGSYNFFNFLTVCLCLLLLDDQMLREMFPAALLRRLRPVGAPVPRLPVPAATVAGMVAVTVAAVYLVLSSILLGNSISRAPVSELSRALVRWSVPLHFAHNYGVFAVMTTRRLEIVFEGSTDGRTWEAYELPYKPGATGRAPVWATPHQPRLDWQLWFAALAPAQQNPWLKRLELGLLTGSPAVLSLFSHNPFPARPPLYIRASLYRYKFSDRETRERSGAWWTREHAGAFMPAAGLASASSILTLEEDY